MLHAATNHSYSARKLSTADFVPDIQLTMNMSLSSVFCYRAGSGYANGYPVLGNSQGGFPCRPRGLWSHIVIRVFLLLGTICLRHPPYPVLPSCPLSRAFPICNLGTRVVAIVPQPSANLSHQQTTPMNMYFRSLLLSKTWLDLSCYPCHVVSLLLRNTHQHTIGPLCEKRDVIHTTGSTSHNVSQRNHTRTEPWSQATCIENFGEVQPCGFWIMLAEQLCSQEFWYGWGLSPFSKFLAAVLSAQALVY